MYTSHFLLSNIANFINVFIQEFFLLWLDFIFKNKEKLDFHIWFFLNTDFGGKIVKKFFFILKDWKILL